MAKNNKKHSITTNVCEDSFNTPDPGPSVGVMNMDDLALLSDDDLYSRLRVIDAERREVIADGVRSYSWDVEMAYGCREMQIRHNRHALHLEYLVAVQRAQRAECYENPETVWN